MVLLQNQQKVLVYLVGFFCCCCFLFGFLCFVFYFLFWLVGFFFFFKPKNKFAFIQKQNEKLKPALFERAMQPFEKADTTTLKSRAGTEHGERDFGPLPKNIFEERRSSFYLSLPIPPISKEARTRINPSRLKSNDQSSAIRHACLPWSQHPALQLRSAGFVPNSSQK